MNSNADTKTPVILPKKRERKKRGYEDTFKFHLFPERTSTAAQRKRLLLFQGRIEHWKAAVNYADSFNDPNKLNVLFLIGYSDKLRAYVEKTSSNLAVLCADVPPEFLKAHDDYWDLIDRYYSVGYADKEGNLSSLWQRQRMGELEAMEKGVLPDDMRVITDREVEVIDVYEAARRDAEVLFSKWLVVSRLFPAQYIAMSDLDKLVKKLYPYGREQAGMGDRAYTASAKRLREAIHVGLSHLDCAKLLHLQGSDSYESCKKGIRRCEMDLNVALRKDGYVNLSQIMERMKHPPYGWSSEVHAAYSFGYAISSHLEDTWIWDDNTCFPASDIIEDMILLTVQGITLHRKNGFVLVEEAGYSLAERFAWLFDIGADRYIPKDETDSKILSLYQSGMSERRIAQELGTMTNIAVHKRLARMKRHSGGGIPMCNMASMVCKKVESITRWTISLIDSRLRDALCGEYDPEKYLSYPIFGRQKVRESLAYFTWDKCKELKKQLSGINELVPAMIRERCGSDADIANIYRTCTTQCSGWLWWSDAFWRCVDRQTALS